MNIYFNKGTANEVIILESDILNMDKPSLKVLKMKCQNAINEVSVKRDIFRTDNMLDKNSKEYWRKMFVYKSIITKYTKAIAWLNSLEVNAKPPKQHEDREHWLWCYYQESMKVLTDEMAEQIKEMADSRAKFHCEIEKWEFKEA